MKMDSAGGVTSIGTTFEVGVCFGFQKKFWKITDYFGGQKSMFHRFTDSTDSPIHRFMAEESVNKSA